MTRYGKSKSAGRSRKSRLTETRFSELVCGVRSEGPRHVTVHGRDEVVFIAAEEFCRLKRGATGKALIEALQGPPYRVVEIELRRGRLPVRDVGL